MADVLLVDDDGSVLLTLAIALRRQGHMVTVACDARQALQHLKHHPYSFVVSDVRMPGMSGIELARCLRRMAHAPRVILTSAYSIELCDGLAEAFLQKPIDIGCLNALLAGDYSNGHDNGHSDTLESLARSAAPKSHGHVPTASHSENAVPAGEFSPA